jgi:hypothetical protein
VALRAQVIDGAQLTSNDKGLLFRTAFGRYIFKEWSSSKASQIRARLAADFRDWKSKNAKFEERVWTLISALRADDGAREPPPQSKL